MDDNTVNTAINGASNRTSTESHLNDQPLPNDTLNRTSERTCTQTLTIPTVEKQDYPNANMLWRKFVQYIKMTKDLDLSKMTNNKEILPQYREWIGHKIDQNGIRPLQDKLMAIKNLEQPNNEKELKSFLGAIQYLSKYIDNLSAQTDSLRQLLKKDKDWLWTEEHTQAFENLKQKITEKPCLAHYNSDYPNIITTDASTKGLGATLWQEQPDGKLKPIGFASRFLSDTEKKYAIIDLELLAVVWGLEHFRLYIYGKPITLPTDHQALEPIIKRNRSNKTYTALN